MKKVQILVVLGTVGVAACSSSSNSEVHSSVGQASSPLWGARLGPGGISFIDHPDENTPAANAVVAIAKSSAMAVGGLFPIPESRCTGVLISPRHVLTS